MTNYMSFKRIFCKRLYNDQRKLCNFIIKPAIIYIRIDFDISFERLQTFN